MDQNLKKIQEDVDSGADEFESQYSQTFNPNTYRNQLSSKKSSHSKNKNLADHSIFDFDNDKSRSIFPTKSKLGEVGSPLGQDLKQLQAVELMKVQDLQDANTLENVNSSSRESKTSWKYERQNAPHRKSKIGNL